MIVIIIRRLLIHGCLLNTTFTFQSVSLASCLQFLFPSLHLFISLQLFAFDVIVSHVLAGVDKELRLMNFKGLDVVLLVIMVDVFFLKHCFEVHYGPVDVVDFLVLVLEADRLNVHKSDLMFVSLET